MNVPVLKFPLVGVPSNGVTKVGLVLNTTLPVPVLVVTPVPPLATFNVPASIMAPVLAVLGVNPVVPALNVVTPPAVPFAAKVICPWAFTVIFALV